jgi:2,4-dienoyl-CoA reductase-like NADH-dependent reductase (Old Yellow Enzyme family)
MFTALSFQSGRSMPNRFMLAPLTNLQSHDDGCLSEDEFKWLSLRAQGGFGMTMTCAAFVQQNGKGFPGQLGIARDEHLPGLQRLAASIRDAGSLSIAQLHHGGMRSQLGPNGEKQLCPSDNEETGARAMTHAEVIETRDAFIAAAVRAEQAGFEGVELHGAHGYLLCEFLSEEINQRTDEYGGSPANRSRIIFEIIDAIREQCAPDFVLGIRLSPERFGMSLKDIINLYTQLCETGKIDFIDMSLWDITKEPEEEAYKGKTLLDIFCELPRHDTHLTAAGKIMSAADIKAAMAAGLDFVALGRAAILHHDYPHQMQADDDFIPVPLPTSREHLVEEGLGPKFVTYMATWKGFVEEA